MSAFYIDSDLCVQEAETITFCREKKEKEASLFSV